MLTIVAVEANNLKGAELRAVLQLAPEEQCRDFI